MGTVLVIHMHNHLNGWKTNNILFTNFDICAETTYQITKILAAKILNLLGKIKAKPS
jgi:hypothetical protein